MNTRTRSSLLALVLSVLGCLLVVAGCSSAPPAASGVSKSAIAGDDTGGTPSADPLAPYTDDLGPVDVTEAQVLTAGPGAPPFGEVCKKAMRLASGAVITCMIACQVTTGSVPTPVGDIADALKDCREKAEQVEEETKPKGDGSQVGDVLSWVDALSKAAFGAIFVCFASGVCEVVLAPVGI
jgi:hypothetical protein